MQIYKDEKIKVPEVGDIFVVKKTDKNTMDLHYGRCTHVKLCPIKRYLLVEASDEKEYAIIWIDEKYG